MRPTAWSLPALVLPSDKVGNALQLPPFKRGSTCHKAGGEIFRICKTLAKFQKSPRSLYRPCVQGDTRNSKSRTGKSRADTEVGPYIALLLLLIPPQVFAVPDIQTIMSNLSHVIVPFTVTTLAVSYAAGVYFILSGLMMMKKMGNFATQQSQPGELSGPMVKILVGAALLYLPSSTDTMTNTIFGNGSNSLFPNKSINYGGLGSGSTLLGYMGADGFNQQWIAIANTLVMYIQFLGLLSFVKGWFIIAGTAGHSSQPGTLSKGFTHIIGGVIAMNFVAAMNTIGTTIGF